VGEQRGREGDEGFRVNGRGMMPRGVSGQGGEKNGWGVAVGLLNRTLSEICEVRNPGRGEK